MGVPIKVVGYVNAVHAFSHNQIKIAQTHSLAGTHLWL